MAPGNNGEAKAWMIGSEMVAKLRDELRGDLRELGGRIDGLSEREASTAAILEALIKQVGSDHDNVLRWNRELDARLRGVEVTYAAKADLEKARKDLEEETSRLTLEVSAIKGTVSRYMGGLAVVVALVQIVVALAGKWLA